MTLHNFLLQFETVENVDDLLDNDDGVGVYLGHAFLPAPLINRETLLGQEHQKCKALKLVLCEYLDLQ